MNPLLNCYYKVHSSVPHGLEAVGGYVIKKIDEGVAGGLPEGRRMAAGVQPEGRWGAAGKPAGPPRCPIICLIGYVKMS